MRFVVFLAWLVLGLGVAPGKAWAHTGTRSSVTVHRDGVRRVVVGIEVPRRDIGEALELAQSGRDPTAAEIEVARARVFRSFASSIRVRVAGRRCEPTDGGLEHGRRAEALTILQTLSFECPRRGAAELRYGWFFERDPMHQAFVRARSPGGEVSRFVLFASRRTRALDLEPTAWGNALEFGQSGIVHIFTGYDHVLFVLGLMLMAGIAVSEAGARRGSLYAAKVITGFTIGHSITLALAGLELVHPPSRLIESAIAASIVYVAVENIIVRRVRPRALLTALFGLVHGFGFAAVLAEEGLPVRGLALSLLAFNVGIELGQLAIVLLLLPPLVLLARGSAFRGRILVPGSVAIALFGVVWLAERSTGLRLLPF